MTTVDADEQALPVPFHEYLTNRAELEALKKRVSDLENSLEQERLAAESPLESMITTEKPTLMETKSPSQPPRVRLSCMEPDPVIAKRNVSQPPVTSIPWTAAAKKSLPTLSPPVPPPPPLKQPDAGMKTSPTLPVPVPSLPSSKQPAVVVTLTNPPQSTATALPLVKKAAPVIQLDDSSSEYRPCDDDGDYDDSDFDDDSDDFQSCKRKADGCKISATAKRTCNVTQPVRRLSAAEQNAYNAIFRSLAELYAIGMQSATVDYVAQLADYMNPGSAAPKGALKALEAEGLISRAKGEVSLTNKGIASRPLVTPPQSNLEIQKRILKILLKDKKVKGVTESNLTLIFWKMCNDWKEHDKKELMKLTKYTNPGSAGFKNIFLKFENLKLLESTGKTSSVKFSASKLFPLNEGQM